MSNADKEGFSTQIGCGENSVNSPKHVEANVIVKSSNKSYNTEVDMEHCLGSLQRNKKESRLTKQKERIREKCTVKKFMILAVIITLIHILILGIHLQFVSDTKVQVTKLYNRFNVSAINKLHDNLNEFVPRYKWEQWSLSIQKKMNVSMSNNNCTYECNTNVKSKVRFLVAKDVSLLCSYKYPDFVCGEGLYQEMNRTLNGGASIKLKDLYYNYVIDMDGRIYEGRSLLCPFDETDLIEDHSSMITVAIPYMFDGYYETNSNFLQRQVVSITHLLTMLNSTGILIENYAVEFPDIFQTFFEQLNKTMEIRNVSFHNNDFYNLSSKWNPETMINLLFLRNHEYTNNSMKVTSLDLYDPIYLKDYASLRSSYYQSYNPNVSATFLYNPKQLTLSTNISNTLIIPRELTFRIIFTEDIYSRNISNSACESSTICQNFLFNIIRENDKLRLYTISYIAILPDILYKVTTLNDSVILIEPWSYNLEVFVPTFNILLLTPNITVSMGYDYWLESFSDLTKQIANNIKRLGLMYEDVHMEFVCGVQIDRKNDHDWFTSENIFFNIIIKAYQMFTKSVKFGKGLEYTEPYEMLKCSQFD